MATITMDTSEYEALKKNIKLLEDSKEREQKLNDEIQALKESQIDKLIEQGKSVSIVNRTIKEENVYVKRNNREIIEAISKLKSGVLSNLSQVDIADALTNYFFEFQPTRTVVDSSVETRGFEDVRKEMEEQFIKEKDAAWQDTLNELSDLREKIKQLNTKTLEVSLNKDEFDRVKTDVQIYKERYNTSERKLKDTQLIIRNLVKSKWNLFNYLEKKEELKNIEEKVKYKF